MERNQARGNIRLGILMGVIAILMLALGFIWALIYINAAHG